jgi:hypothetical protein
MRTKRFSWLTITPLFVFFMVSHTQASVFNVQDVDLQACLQELALMNQWSQPEDVIEVKCHNKDIRSLQGLEQFTHLESLSLYNNKLEYVDINLSYFKQLIVLNLSRNNLVQLTITDLPKLNKVYLFNNAMKDLNLSNLINLEVLKANNNKIENFSYSNIPKLEKMYIFNNQLEAININDLPSLQYMDCRQNPMPDSLYDEMDKVDNTTFLHDGNADDW